MERQVYSCLFVFVVHLCFFFINLFFSNKKKGLFPGNYTEELEDEPEIQSPNIKVDPKKIRPGIYELQVKKEKKTKQKLKKKKMFNILM